MNQPIHARAAAHEDHGKPRHGPGFSRHSTKQHPATLPRSNIVRHLNVLIGAALALLLCAAPAFAQTAFPKSFQVANNTTSVAICPSTCTVSAIYVQNNSATIAYLKLYNATQAATTCGSGTPVDRIMIPANASGAGAVIPYGSQPGGVAFPSALTACVTTGFADNDTTAPAASAYQFTIYAR